MLLLRKLRDGREQKRGIENGESGTPDMRKAYTRQSTSNYQASIRTKKPLSFGKKPGQSKGTARIRLKPTKKDNENTQRSLQNGQRLGSTDENEKNWRQEVFGIQEKRQALTLRSAYKDEDCSLHLYGLLDIFSNCEQ